MFAKCRKAQKVMFIVVIVALLSVSVAPMSVGATPINPQGPNPPIQDVPAEFAELANRAMAYENAIRTMEKYISVANDGTLVLSVKSGKSIGVDEKIFQQLTKALEETNKQLRSGQLSLAEVHLDSGTSSLNSDTAAVGDAVTCAGINGFRFFWWGMRAYFNSCRTEDIILAAGSGGQVLCGLLSVWGTPASTAICSIISGVGSLYIAWLNNRWGRGIMVNHLIVNPGLPLVWHQ